MKLPNFFIVGAAKAGTTGLYHTIKQHPDIYMSPAKEPKYFAFPGPPPVLPGPCGQNYCRSTVWQPRRYAMLFAQAAHQRAIGEASVLYLRSPLAARRIRESLPHSRIVAVLRQPAERAYSHYTFMRQKGVEPAPTFAEGLALEPDRIRAHWFSGFFYRTNGNYHAQLAPYYELFPREQIRVYLYEDWLDDPFGMLGDLFRFLEVDDGFRPEIRHRNVTLLPKSRRLHHWTLRLQKLDRQGSAPSPLPRRMLKGALHRIDAALNLAPPPPLAHETRADLTASYHEEIEKLQNLIGRDLSPWLKP